MRASRSRPGARRRALVDAVSAVLLEEGFSGLGPNAVARRAEANKQLVYHHFGSFEALLDTWADEQDLWPSVDDLVGGDPERFRTMLPAARWSTVVRRYLRGLRARPVTQRLLVWTLAERTPIDDRVVGGRDALLGEIAELFPEVPRQPRESLVVLLGSAVETLVLAAWARGRFGPLALGSDADWDEIEALLAIAGRGLLDVSSA